MLQGDIAPEAFKPKKQIDSIAAWLKGATQKRNLNNPKFLFDTKGFLLTCELKEKIAPIIAAWEKTPITNKTIESIYKVLADHYSTERLTKAERTAVSSNWTVSIYGRILLDDKTQGPMMLLDRGKFEKGWDAEQFADRRLLNQPSNAYAVIEAHTEKTRLIVYRADALARSEKRKVPCATTDQVKVSKDRLSFGCGGQYNKRVYFSRG